MCVKYTVSVLTSLLFCSIISQLIVIADVRLKYNSIEVNKLLMLHRPHLVDINAFDAKVSEKSILTTPDRDIIRCSIGWKYYRNQCREILVGLFERH